MRPPSPSKTLATSFAVALLLAVGGCAATYPDAAPVNGPLERGGALSARAKKAYVLQVEGRVVEASGSQAAWFGPLHSLLPLRSGMRAALAARAFPSEHFDAVVTRVGYVDGDQFVFKTELSHRDGRLTPGTAVTARIVLGDEPARPFERVTSSVGARGTDVTGGPPWRL